MCFDKPFFMQAANNTAVPLNEIPQAQAPAVVVTVNDKEVVHATVVFDGEILYSFNKPSAFQCIALLLAGYFIFQIAFPGPYQELLYTFKHILHGDTSINPVVRNFFKAYSKAVKSTTKRKCE